MLSKTYSFRVRSNCDFQKNGHVFLENVLPEDELKPYREAIRAWAVDFKKNQKPMEERDTYGKAFLQMMNLWEENELIKQFSLAKRFGKIAAELLGVKECTFIPRSGFIQRAWWRFNSLASRSILLADGHRQNSHDVDAFGRHRRWDGDVDFCVRQSAC
jgi:hypothetical protein